MKLTRLKRGAFYASLIFFLISATDGQGADADIKLTEKGRAIFFANCISCHNKDPNKRGALGPELTDTPLEVMMLKIPTGQSYPEGYIPKRKTKIMKKFPHLKKNIPAIHAWIQSQKKNGAP